MSSSVCNPYNPDEIIPPPCPTCGEASDGGSKVQPQNGKPQIGDPGLASSANGLEMEQKICFTPADDFENICPDAFPNGNNFSMSNVPQLVQLESGDVIAVVFNAQEAYWFVEIDNEYIPRFGAHQTLTHDAQTNLFTFTYPDGRKWQFRDFDQYEHPLGALYKSSSPGGQTATASYDEDDRLTQLEQTDGTTTESYQYAYDANDRIQSVTLVRGGTNIQKVEYAYYDGEENYGSLGDLKSSTRWEYIDDDWVERDVRYYRYYTSGEGNGFKHAMKYVLGPRAYQRMVDDGYNDPTSATNAQVADYADNYFEYDANQRADKAVAAGGTRTYTFAYTTQEPANTDYNNWRTKSVETRPDGSTMTIYTNHVGQALLRELVKGDDGWTEYFVYGETGYPGEGKLVEHWTPAAVDSYVDNGGTNNDEIVVTSTGEGEEYGHLGLIHVTDYYGENPSPAAGASTAGGVEGYVRYQKVKEGDSGTEIKISETKYFSRSDGTMTIYPVAEQTVYQSDASGGGDPATTTFSYSWYSDTHQIQERTVESPVVAAAHNGPGGETGATRKEYFDSYGNLTWSKDERGRVTYHDYETTTGARERTIEDVDSDQSSGLNPPSGYAGNSDGLHLVSDFETDSLARTTRSLGPAHDIGGVSVRTADWTVYDDVNHEVRSARGYQTVSTEAFSLVNPVSIVKNDADGRTLESIEAVWDGTVAEFLAADYDDFPQTGFVRWTTRQYENTLLTFTRQYHNIPASGAGLSDVNYAETSYGHDSMGRQNMQETPGGTITRTVFDCRGNPTEVYVGTDDTGASDIDPTNNHAPPNNMVLVTELAYDGAGGSGGCGSCDGGNGNLTQSTLHVDGDADHDRATDHTYDWRNRRTTTQTTDGTTVYITKNTHDNLDRATQVDRYHTSTASGNLVARAKTYYDKLSRPYKTERVPVVDGTPGAALATNYWYDAAGNKTTLEDPLERQTTWEYDPLNRVKKETLPDPDGEGAELAPWTVYIYDEAGNLTSTTDRLDHSTTFGYDPIGRKVSATDPNDDTTEFSYDTAGNMGSLTDPEENVTAWTHDHADRVVEEENELGALRTFQHDAEGKLVRKIDRNSCVTEYQYDYLKRQTSETWKLGEETVREFSFTHNLGGDLLSAADPSAAYGYQYDGLGRATSIAATITGLRPVVTLVQEHNSLGLRSKLSSWLGESRDFINDFSYDGHGRMSMLKQQDTTGGNAVAAKRIDFAYDSADQFSTITRYNNLAGTQTVAQSSHTFDLTGRLTDLTHTKGETTLADYDWSFDAANRMTQYVNSVDGTVNYTNDNASQLTVADYTYQPPLTDESYTYDSNGNRTNNGYSTGANNRLLSDGTYTYTYDAEGNRLTRTHSATGALTRYTRDHRNRLVCVAEYADSDPATPPYNVVEHSYDYLNRWIKRTTSADNQQTIFVHDDNQIALQFDKTGTGDLAAADLSHRYTWGPLVDQILADEQVTSLETAGSMLWPLCDHLNTVRDIASYNSGTDTTTVANHRVYNAFGKLISETNSSVTCLFYFTARPLDLSTFLQNNLHRWYDPAVGRWLSEDHIWDDDNPYRYVGNNPTNAVDPSGKRACETIDLLLKDGYKLDAGTDCATINLTEYLDWRKKHNYPPVPDAFLDQLDRGCIGLCAGGQACDPNKGPYSDWPERAPNTTCYRTEAKARTQKCPEGTTTFYFAKMGRPYSQDNPWIIPNEDGTFNYVTYNVGCYMDMNCGAGYGVAQVIRFCEKHPGPGGHYPAWMWCVTCKPCEK